MLDESCLSFVGSDLWVHPNYGWGWNRDGSPLPPEDFERIEAAGCFKVRVDRLFRFAGELRGVVGRIVADGHPFGDLNVVAAEMLVGEHDFNERLCRRYDLWIGPGSITLDDWPSITGPGLIGGYGTVGASTSALEAFWRTLSA